MILFSEFMSLEQRKVVEKLKELKKHLERVEKFRVRDFTDNEQTPYIFVQLPIDSKLNDALRQVGLGIRVFVMGGNMVYRLQIGPKGGPIGPAKKLEDQEEIEDLVQQGKTEEQAYNEMMRRVPNEFRKYLKKVARNIEGSKSRLPDDTDNERYMAILNQMITGSVEDGAFKM